MKSKRSKAPEDELEEGTGAPATEAAEAPGAAAEESGGEPDGSDGGAEDADPFAALEADVLKWKELAMRTAADLENFRKRSAREREESIRYANQSLLEELLPILDNFEMGMQAASQEKDSMIYVGMEMVRNQFGDYLSNNGVTEIDAEGNDFDPNLHDAVSQEEAEGVEDGKVVRVTRRGFLLRDRLLRPASVVVAKSGDSEEA